MQITCMLMSQNPPTSGFRWVSNPDKLKDSILELAKEVRKDALLVVGKSYLLEADVSYLDDLHNLHNNLPFMYEKKKIKGVQKLVPNLYDEQKYVIHIAALTQALKHVLVLDRVHQVIKFVQSAWLAPYIDFNTQPRTKVKNDFEKGFSKLMNNSVLRKTMENIRRDILRG